MNKRYQVLNPLDSNTYLGFDQLNNQEVILTNIPQPESSGMTLQLLNRLYLATTIRQNNLDPVLDYKVEDEHITIISQVTPETRPFLETLQNADRDAKFQALIVLLEILQYLHEHHLVHGRISPETVRVGQDGNLLVQEFGYTLDTTAQDDLYAVGILLYMLMVDDSSLDFHRLIASETTPEVDVINTGDDTYDDRLRMILFWLFACKAGNGYATASVVIDAINSLRENTSPPMAVIKQGYMPYPLLVERDRTVKRFDKLLDKAGKQQGALWFLNGAHGIGKTRLLMEFKHLAQQKGYTVVSARANQWQSTWMNIIKQLLVAQDIHLEQEHARILRQIDPEIERILNLPDDPDMGDISVSVERVSEVITSLLEEVKAPTVVFIDDFEYLNDFPITLGYIHAVIGTLPLIFVCTTAVDEQIKALKNRYPNGTFINVKPLTIDGTNQLCQHYSETPVHRLVAQYVFEQSQGNPFYAVETIYQLIDHSGRMEHVNYLDLPKDLYPKGATDIATSYLEDIPQVIEEPVILSAMLGNTVNLPLLNLLIGNIESEPEWLYNDLFLVEFEQWAFRNNIIREGILKKLDQEDRKRYSRYIAEKIENEYQGAADVASLLVYYWHMAGDLERELENIRISLTHLMDNSHDFLLAREMVERALTLLQQTGNETDENQLIFLQLLGDICLKQQETSQSLMYYYQALSLSRIQNVRHQELQILRRIARVMIQQDENHEAMTALERAFKIATQIDDKPNIAFVLYEITLHHIRLNNYDQAYKTIQRCLRVFDVLPTDEPEIRDLLTRVYSAKGAIVSHHGDAEQAIEILQTAISRIRQFNNRRELVETLDLYARVLIEQFAFEQAEAIYDEVLQHYLQLRDYVAYQKVLIDKARLLMMMGKLEDAQTVIDNALMPDHYIHEPELMAVALINAGMIAFSAGDFKNAVDYYRRSLELSESHGLKAYAVESTARRAVAMLNNEPKQINQARYIVTGAAKMAVQMSNHQSLQVTILVQLLHIMINLGLYITAVKSINNVLDHPAHDALHEFEIRHYIMPVLEEHMPDDELQIYMNSEERAESLTQCLVDVLHMVE